MTRVEEALKEHGGPLLGLAVQQYNPAFVEMMGYLGLHVVWIEMEHQQVTLRECVDLCRVAAGAGLLTMIRIPDARRESVLKAAECGPDIIDLPMANTPDIVAELVSHAKYPPVGNRGFFGASRALRYGASGDIVAERERVNRELCLMGQIETRGAAERADEISRTPGLDAVFIGPGDLSSSLGLTGQTKHPLVLDTMHAVIQAAKANGRLVSLPGSPADAGYWAARGVDLYFIGSDISCMAAGLKQAVAQARGGEALSGG